MRWDRSHSLGCLFFGCVCVEMNLKLSVEHRTRVALVNLFTFYMVVALQVLGVVVAQCALNIRLLTAVRLIMPIRLYQMSSSVYRSLNRAGIRLSI